MGIWFVFVFCISQFHPPNAKPCLIFSSVALRRTSVDSDVKGAGGSGRIAVRGSSVVALRRTLSSLV